MIRLSTLTIVALALLAFVQTVTPAASATIDTFSTLASTQR